jgi:hypothetical protein
MAVKVVSSNGRVRADSEHQDGTGIEVRESGHLIVVRDGSALAIHAPGSWISAEVTK